MQSGSEASTEVIAVGVPGGSLAVEHVIAGGGPLLAIHGISSQRKLWNWLRAQRPGLSLIAPDLRGRGDSVGVSGPSSVAQHAADLIAVLDHLGLDAVPVCGMSMGGFVAVELATTYPDRVTDLVLVDGGFPMASSSRCRPGCSPRSGEPGRTARRPTRRRPSRSSATRWGHRARWSACRPWWVSITPRRS